MAPLKEFKSPRIKLDRAKKHLADLEVEIDSYFELVRFEVFAINDCTMRIVVGSGKPLSDNINLIAADAINNLRAALDQAVSASVRALGDTNTNATYFPFGNDLEHFESQRAQKTKKVCAEVVSLITAFKPYPDGNPVLWSLHKLCNSDKHNEIVSGVVLGGIKDHGRIISSIWDEEAGMTDFVVTNIPDGGSGFQFSFGLEYPGIGSVAGRPFAALLDEIASVCERVVMGIEAETARVLAIQG